MNPPSNVNPRRPEAGAFTLVELLVAIAIVLVLMSFILAGSSLVLKKANDTKSLNNLSQLVKGLNLYLADNGAYPYAVNTDTNNAFIGGFWAIAIRPYLESQSTGTKPRVFVCPNEKKHNGLSDYGVNGMAINRNPASFYIPPRVPVTIASLSQCVLISDARDTSVPTPGGAWLVDGQVWIANGTSGTHPFAAWPPRNSSGRVFAGFFDGRVEAISSNRWATNRVQFFDPTYAP